MTKRSPERILDAIEAWDDDDKVDAEMERILALTPEQRAEELRAAGVDVEAERAKAQEWRAQHAPESQGARASQALPGALPAQAAPTSKVVRLSVRTRWTIAAIAAAFGALGVAIFATRPIEVAASPDQAARELRRHAFAACDGQRWGECLQGLDEARRLDPSGESDARVRDYRQRAEDRVKGP